MEATKPFGFFAAAAVRNARNPHEFAAFLRSTTKRFGFVRVSCVFFRVLPELRLFIVQSRHAGQLVARQKL